MPYIQRANGAVTGIFANPQPGYAEEWLADDHPDVAAFLNPPDPIPQSITKRQLLLGLMIDQWITPAEAEAWADNTALPGPINDVIEAMPAEQQPAARITAKTMSVAERDNPLLRAAAQAAMPDASDDEVEAALDQAFIEWAKL